MEKSTSGAPWAWSGSHRGPRWPLIKLPPPSSGVKLHLTGSMGEMSSFSSPGPTPSSVE